MAHTLQLLVDRVRLGVIGGADKNITMNKHRQFALGRNSRRAQRLGAFWLSLVLAGCVGGGFGPNEGYDAPREMFVSGYEKIQSVYIQQVDLGDLAVAGLTQVASLDPTLAVSREADKVGDG